VAEEIRFEDGRSAWQILQAQATSSVAYDVDTILMVGATPTSDQSLISSAEDSSDTMVQDLASADLNYLRFTLEALIQKGVRINPDFKVQIINFALDPSQDYLTMDPIPKGDVLICCFIYDPPGRSQLTHSASASSLLGLRPRSLLEDNFCRVSPAHLEDPHIWAQRASLSGVKAISIFGGQQTEVSVFNFMSRDADKGVTRIQNRAPFFDLVFTCSFYQEWRARKVSMGSSPTEYKCGES
jgi:hypothetical protein